MEKADNNIVVSVVNLKKSFGDNVVLDGITVDIHKGENFVVLGRSGSGKSTVAELFAEKGIFIIDTDEIARQLTLPGQNALHKIVEKFGRRILLPDKTLNRAHLRKIIFADPHKRRWIEKLLHPLIRAEMDVHRPLIA